MDAAQTRDRSREERSKALAVLRTRAEGLRRQAGDAALRAAGLKQRFGLTDAVPCRGTELQPRCQLLADAREAQVMLPSADTEVAKVRVTLDAVNAEIRTLEATVDELGDTAKAVRAAQAELQRLTEERRRVEALAALGANLEQAERRLAEYATTEEEIGASLTLARGRCRREAKEARSNIAALDERAKEQTENAAASIVAIEAELAGLPPAFDLNRLAAAEAPLRAARAQVEKTGHGLPTGHEGRGVAPGATRQRESPKRGSGSVARRRDAHRGRAWLVESAQQGLGQRRRDRTLRR